ncbi:MAG: hypothetical protein WBV67_17420 [Candidatus Cybelea sp.]
MGAPTPNPLTPGAVSDAGTTLGCAATNGVKSEIESRAPVSSVHVVGTLSILHANCGCVPYCTIGMTIAPAGGVYEPGV